MADVWGWRRKLQYAFILAHFTAFITTLIKNGQIEASTATPATLPLTFSVNSTLSWRSNSSNVSNIGNTTVAPSPSVSPTVLPSADPSAVCPDGALCSVLGGSCINCEFNDSCVYGKDFYVRCKALDFVICEGPRTFERIFNCRYCYQTLQEHQRCVKKTKCKVISGKSSPPRYLTNCTVKEEILCLGNRTFNKYLYCNWTSGYRWSTAVLLSLTLGGFGIDRFYLGYWKEGLGKLFSFGGLGVWTLVDLVLVGIGYIGPADGSLYIF